VIRITRGVFIMSLTSKFFSGISTVIFMLCMLPLGLGFMAAMFLLRMAIILGALNEIFHFSHLDSAPQDISNIIFFALINSWEKFAILVVFIESWKRRHGFEEIRETNSNMKRLMCIVGGYFNIGFSTKRTDILREKGFVHCYWHNTNQDIKRLFNGISALDDDDTTAYPTRGFGDKKGDVTFEQDMKNVFSSSLKP